MGGTPNSLAAERRDTATLSCEPVPRAECILDAATARPLRGIIFDMADVLYDATSWRRWLLQLLARFGVQADYRAFFVTWDEEYLVEVQCGRREFDEAFQSFLSASGLSRGQINELEAATRMRREQFDRLARPFPSVAPTLRRLSGQGLALSVLADADCPATALEAKLRNLGLGGVFQSVWSSIDLEVTTPAPLGYQRALSAMKLTGPEVAYVGNTARGLRGAAAAGLRTIAFNDEYGAQADVHVAWFPELYTVATRWQTPVSELQQAAGQRSQAA